MPWRLNGLSDPAPIGPANIGEWKIVRPLRPDNTVALRADVLDRKFQFQIHHVAISRPAHVLSVPDLRETIGFIIDGLLLPDLRDGEVRPGHFSCVGKGVDQGRFENQTAAQLFRTGQR